MSNSIDSTTNGVRYDTQPQGCEKKQSFGQNVLAGSVSGFTAAGMIQWMIYFKNVKQAAAAEGGAKVHFSKDPRVWYRGFGGFAASFTPTVAIQTAANGYFSAIFSPFFAASAAGVVSAIVVCPAEGIMIQQQKTGKNFWVTARQVYSVYGYHGYFRGFVPTAIREGVFTAAYLAAAPKLKQKMRTGGVNEWVVQTAAGPIAGVAAAAISHPFDTFKTQKQRDFSMKTPMHKGICQKSAFAGFGWRAAMVTTAITAMSFVQENIQDKMK